MNRDLIFALGMTAFGTYAPGLEKAYMPKKFNVKTTKYKVIKLEIDDSQSHGGKTK